MLVHDIFLSFDYLFTKTSIYVLKIGNIDLNCKIANSSMDWNFITQLLILVIVQVHCRLICQIYSLIVRKLWKMPIKVSFSLKRRHEMSFYLKKKLKIQEYRICLMSNKEKATHSQNEDPATIDFQSFLLERLLKWFINGNIISLSILTFLQIHVKKSIKFFLFSRYFEGFHSRKMFCSLVIASYSHASTWMIGIFIQIYINICVCVNNYFLLLQESQRFLWTGRVADKRDILEAPRESRFR